VSSNYGLKEYKINMAILIKEQVNNQLNQNYQLNEIRIFFKITKDMGILEKDSNKVKVKIEIEDYEENFDFKLI